MTNHISSRGVIYSRFLFFCEHDFFFSLFGGTNSRPQETYIYIYIYFCLQGMISFRCPFSFAGVSWYVLRRLFTSPGENLCLQEFIVHSALCQRSNMIPNTFSGRTTFSLGGGGHETWEGERETGRENSLVKGEIKKKKILSTY